MNENDDLNQCYNLLGLGKNTNLYVASACMLFERVASFNIRFVVKKAGYFFLSLETVLHLHYGS